MLFQKSTLTLVISLLLLSTRLFGQDPVNAELYLCTFQNSQEIELEIRNADGFVISAMQGDPTELIQFDELELEFGTCYTAVLRNNSGPYGWYFGYFWIRYYELQVINAGLSYGSAYLEIPFSLDNTCTAIVGCTNPEALNYNANANVDDGSCFVCDLSTSEQVDLNFYYDGDIPGQLLIMDELGNLIAVVTSSYAMPYQSIDLCLQPGQCYTAMLTTNNAVGNNYYAGLGIGQGNSVFLDADMYGVGSGIPMPFSVDGTCGANPGCIDPLAANYDPAADIMDGTCIYPGCTDPDAFNYDYEANQDDGSCVYCEGPDFQELHLGIFSEENGDAIGAKIVDSNGDTLIEVNGIESGEPAHYYVCVAVNECYHIEMSNIEGGYGWGQSQLSLSTTGSWWNTTLLATFLPDTAQSITDFFTINGTCEGDTIQGCTNSSSINYNPVAAIDDGSCIPMIPGCMDAEALNFNPEANYDLGCFIASDCFHNLVQFKFIGTDPNASFTLVDTLQNIVLDITNSQFNPPFEYSCLQSGCYRLRLAAESSAGWQNTSLHLFVNGVWQQSFDLILDNAEIIKISIGDNECPVNYFGCTNNGALNYNPLATIDDGSCFIPGSCLNDITVTATLTTQGWGNEISWALVGANGETIESQSNLESWTEYESHFCLTYGCFTIELNDSWGDGWNGATLELARGGLIEEFTLEYGHSQTITYQTSVNCFDVYGCTDSAALNYNPQANVDDGSCTFNDNEFQIANDRTQPSLIVYPNPAEQIIRAQLSNIECIGLEQIEIFTAEGRIVHKRSLPEATSFINEDFDISGLPAGFYLLKFSNGSTTLHESFIKLR